MATVGILNVGAGDTKLSFDPNNPQDAIRAARIVRDMLRRGYALLIDTGQRDKNDRPIYTRAKDFDESKCEYIIADFDPTVAEPEDHSDEQTAAPTNGEARAEGRSKSRRKRIQAATVNAVAVARTAGG